MVSQVALDRIQHLRLVVDSQNHRFRHRDQWSRVVDRQRNPELGSSGARLEVDIAVVAADQPAGDVEAETRALPDRFGGEERVEDLRAEDVGGMPGPSSMMRTSTKPRRALAGDCDVAASATASSALSMRFVHT